MQFSDLFSPVPETRRAYFDGLSAVPIIFLSLFLAWIFLTLLLKCKGADVGCASGRAFISVRSDDEDDEVDEEKLDEDLASTSESSNTDTIGESSVNPIFVKSGGDAMQHSDSDHTRDNNDHCGKTVLGCFKRKNRKADKDNTELNRLECRTRISFLVFASLVLICAPLCIVLTFGPLREMAIEMSTTETPDGLFPVSTRMKDGTVCR